MKYYSLSKILSYNAMYNVIFGERTNGKTFSVLELAVKEYFNEGKQLAIVRRWREDFKGKRGQQMFDALVAKNKIKQITKNKWTNVYYYASKWFLCRYDSNNNRICDDTPIAYAFSISEMEHDKSTSYPNVGNILFDEFISRTGYLPNEFVLFMNVLSTIIRERNMVKIFMLGNSVNKYCPYFNEMGLSHVKKMKQGTIDLYKYGDSKLTVAVEYTESTKKGKKSDDYFAFDNPKLNMITSGGWELEIYPHLPCKYKPQDVIFIYFIEYDNELLQCNVIQNDVAYFTYIHRKTSDIKNPSEELIFTPEIHVEDNYRRFINKPFDRIGESIAEHYRKDKVFYQDNDVGEVVRNYLMWCGKRNI